MRLVPPIILFFLATIILVATCHGSDHDLSFQINPIRMKTGPSFINKNNPETFCSSWRVGVEAHNIINWKNVPEECEDYIRNYILGEQYREDFRVVTREAYLYASKSLNLSGDGKDVWVFDIDETTLSNVPYFAKHRFGVEPLDYKSFNDWVIEGKAKRLNESYALYKKLLDLGIKVVFLTGRFQDQKEITVQNLKDAGYRTREKLILRDISKYGFNVSSQEYKSSERENLEKKGYKIVGNMGDQWSDILGSNTGYRTFKLPNPMIYFA